ncbi:acyltransferase family protein [Frateuria defendens]|uniref:acyltransferase family protein n=1 Tax=Frateuria defendens TaxID=2219559 RepID=UPI00066FE216|nr:acyltransferase family protein [Frateuria defendens]
MSDYGLGYRRDIEGLRAVAILLVVAAHAGVPWLAGGFVGVDVFFVLSGFLITSLLAGEVAQTGRLDFAGFYVRRLRRLLPGLLVMLLVAGVLAAFLLAPAEQRSQATAAATAALWVSNIHFALARLDYFAAGADTNLFLHTWSLGVEEQFYLLWPALVWWLLRRGEFERARTRLVAGMLAVMAASLFAGVWLTYSAPQLAFYMMPSRAWQFAAGALVSLQWQLRKCSDAEDAASRAGSAAAWPVLGWVGLGAIVAAGVLFNAAMPYPGMAALVPSLGAALLIAAGTVDPAAGVSKALSWRPLQAIGRISYAWYLWHWPVLLLGRALVGTDAPAYRLLWVGLSLLLAAASYRWIESPIRRQRQWTVQWRRSLLAALCVMILANVLCIRWYNRTDAQAQAPAQQRYLQAHADAPAIYGLGCDDWYRSDRVRICAFGSSAARHSVVLMGDSIAGQWFPAVAKVFDKPDWRVLVLTKSSCPMVDEPFFYARIGREYTECAAWRSHALAEVARIRPDVVLLGTVATNGFTEPQWVEGTARVLSAISGSAGRIYVLRGTPRLPFDGPNCLASHVGRPAWLGTGDCSASSRDAHDELVYAWLTRASRRFGNVAMLDLNDVICPSGLCDAQRQGVVVFRDGQHLTATYAASLGGVLRDRLGMSAEAGAGSGAMAH